RAANDHTRSRGTTTESSTDTPKYQWLAGEKKGEDIDLKAEGFSLTPERAARDLSNYRKQGLQALANEQAQSLAAEVDAYRAEANAQTPQQPSANANQEITPEAQATEAPAQQPTPGVPSKLAEALADPESRRAIEAPLLQAAQAQQQFANGLRETADFA